MSHGPFAKFVGKEIKISSPHFFGYVPTSDEYEDMTAEAAEDLHPEGELEEGWTMVAISGALEEGEMVQMDGFIAVNLETGAFYLCDEGSIEEQEGNFNQLVIEADEN